MARDVINLSGVARDDRKPRVPRMKVRRGVAGYVGEADGRVDVYEPEAPLVNLVDATEDDEDEPEGEDAQPKRRRQSANKERKPAEDK